MSAFDNKPLRPIVVTVSPDGDDSALQLAALVLALRDAHVTMLAELTGKTEREIDQVIDDSYERYYDELARQTEETRERASRSNAF